MLVFQFKSLRDLHIGIFKLGKKYMVKLFSSHRPSIGGVEKEGKGFQFRSKINRGCTLLLSSIEGNKNLTRSFKDFSKRVREMNEKQYSEGGATRKYRKRETTKL